MAEVKNSFTSAKMNQDLDDRLIPSNEYRSARNISIVSSDSSNTGAIENILGNIQLAGTYGEGSSIIGYTYNTTTNSLYVLITNYTDTSANQLDDHPQYRDRDEELVNAIAKIDLNTGVTILLVYGLFLNLSTTHPVTGINLIENLLFWTDNRNQPRKINVDTALNDFKYYYKEEQISVAKYAPLSSIKFINNGVCTMKDVVSKFIPVDKGTGSVPAFPNIVNTDYNADYAGDPNYLQDKFVRFSYRFRFDDGEYSIMAPFSQIAFIPQQDGSFLEGDEDNTYRSTIVSFMKNKVNQIGLIIPMPTTCNKLFPEFKITEIDILYKESDGLSVSVLDVINKASFSTVTDSYYNYTYQSRKPIRTLPADQLTRVFDKTPVRALAQEAVGGRVIYGNYIDKNTPPNSLEYSVSVAQKSTDIKTQYPLHTVKQNRNYQVGIVLSDMFGRQSDVILSTITQDGTLVPGGGFFGGSSFYAPYLPDTTSVLNFVGNSIKILFTDYISSKREQLNDLGIPASGEPGLYEKGGGLLSFEYGGNDTTLGSGLIDDTYEDVPVTIGNNYTGATMTVVVSGNEMSVANSFITAPGSGIRLYTNIKISIPGQSEEAVLPVMTAINVTSPNPMGWYSYKVVVKQNQQEYYNVYVPGALAGYPAPSGSAVAFPLDEDNKTSNIVLFSDNINKVPRDLSEVGPDQKQYRSSVKLFGRVQNAYIGTATNNIQFVPTNKGFSITTLANSSDVEMTPTTVTTNLYQLNTNPIIGRISTNGGGGFGVANTNFSPYLSVLETDPVISNLDIYWETSTTGLISELNYLISLEKPGAYTFINDNYLQFEDQNFEGTYDTTGDQNSKYVTDWFYPVSYTSQRLDTATASLVGVIDGNGNNLLSPIARFALESRTISGQNSYRLKIISNFYFNSLPSLNQFTFTIAVDDPVSSTINNVNLSGRVRNISPTIAPFSIPLLYSGTTDIYTFTGVNGSFGPTPTSTITSDLVWTFSNGTQTFIGGVGVSEFTLTLTPTSSPIGCNLSVTSGNPRTLETPTLVLTDSGLLIDTALLTLDFRLGEFSPAEFTTEFNL